MNYDSCLTIALKNLLNSLSLTLRPTVSQPICLGTKHPFRGLRPDLDYCLTVAGLLVWGALSDDRTGLPFAIATGLRQHIIFGSESRRTRDHILLSHIRDFLFRRLLRRAGSRWRYSTPPPESESYVTTDGQSASLSWNKAPIWGLRPDLQYCQRVAGFLLWGVLSDERTGLSFAIATGPRQRSHSRVQVPCNSRQYLTVSDLRLPFSSPPTTRRVTVEVFDPASTQV
jgi:hypothetical protein